MSAVSSNIRAVRRRLIMLVVGSMLPLIVLSISIIVLNYRADRADASERVLQSTRSAIAAVDRELQNQISGLHVLALSPALQRGDFEAFRGEAERFAMRYGPDVGVGVADASGQQVFNTLAAPGQQIPRRTAMLTLDAVFRTGKPAVSNVYIGAIRKQRGVSVDVPVMRDGKVLYDLFFQPPLPIFADILTRLALPEGWVVSIFDRDLHHVARIPALSGDEITSAAVSLSAELNQRAEGVADTVSLEGTPLLTAFSRSDESSWSVAIGLPADELSGPARRGILVAIVLCAGLIFVSFGFATQMAGWLARAELDRESLIAELNHRVKNTLSVVQAIVNQTFRTRADAATIQKALDTRIVALARAHDVLSDRNWQGASLRETAELVLQPYLLGEARVRLEGPEVKLSPRVSVVIALVLNELVTNAAKYGALQTAAGEIELRWFAPKSGEMVLSWRERGGPSVVPPAQKGFGTQFIERCVTGDLQGSIEMSFAPGGLACIMSLKV